MEIISARISKYRTIKDEMLISNIKEGITLVGPNNAGKTNVLKAIRLFFTGYNNYFKYERENDLSFGEGRNKTNIAITFRIDPEKDQEVNANIETIINLLGNKIQKTDEITVYLTFSYSSKPIYRVYPNVKRPIGANNKANYSRAERSLMDIIFNKFSIHYIPSDKNSEQLYNDLILPFLLKRAFSALEPYMNELRSEMNSVANALNKSLEQAGIQEFKCAFSFPQDPNRVFKEVNFSICDTDPTSIFNKGMGIQASAVFSSFNWITNEETKAGKNVLWLLEEPESYLHPELASQCNKMIKELNKHSQVICTTHSLGFVPQNPRKILGVEREGNWTKIHTFTTYHEATGKIRKSLGVRFSDFYNLNYFNVIVEGETDREYLEYLGKYINDLDIKKEFPIITSDKVSYLDQGGITDTAGFVRATYKFIREERPCIVLIDGDEAGDKSRKALQKYFSNKGIPFESNKNFIIVKNRLPIEGLFPDSWISSINREHSTWISDYATDSEGKLMPFKVSDGHKRHFMEKMFLKIKKEKDHNWAKNWLTLLYGIEKALYNEGRRIYGNELNKLISNEG